MNAIVSQRTVRFGDGKVATFTKASKFKNKRCEVDGILFASKRERERYLALKLRERAGEVRNLRTQVEYRLEVRGALICKYRADFVYEERQHDPRKPPTERTFWVAVVEDVKGFKTPVYRLKKKLMRACHGIELRET